MEEIKRLLKYLRPHLPLFIIAIAAMVLTALLETAIGALLVPLVDQFESPGKESSSTIFNLQELIPRDDWYQAWLMIASLLLGFTLLKGVFSYISSYLMSKIGQSAVLDMRRELYSHLIYQSTAFFENHRTNFLVSRLVISCAAIENALAGNLRDVLRETFMLICFVSAAFYFNWRLTLGALIIGPIIAVLTSKFSKSIRRLADLSLKGNQRLTDTAQEALSNQTIVKAYSAEETEKQRFSAVAELIASANLRSGKLAALSPPTIETIGVVAAVVFFYFGLREINIGNMEASQFFAFLFFLFRSYDPMRKISRQHNEISKAFAAAQDIWEVLDQDEKLPVKKNAKRISGLKDAITIEKLVFAYGEAEGPVLDKISFKIKKGQSVALVGESGGGKSSLIKLIQRLYDPVSGSILWDGIDLRDVNLADLRNQYALVMQETVLFNESIRHNIAYGGFKADQAEIENAAKIAFADVFIDTLPDGYDTVVGERGNLLSGGQKQRIAIARAVLADAPVLILDEATSSLDPESEQFVKSAIHNLMKGRTSIVIAHRLSTVRRADKIFVLEKGKIVEEGTHDQLILKKGKYRLLYEMQFADDNTNEEPER